MVRKKVEISKLTALVGMKIIREIGIAKILRLKSPS
jgi:hypothetical protein